MRRMIPYSVDITGNFVYSPQLIEARKQVQEGLLNAAQLLEIENKEIQHIVDTCKQIGLKCVTDGDYRSNGYTDFFIIFKTFPSTKQNQTIRQKKMINPLYAGK